VGGFDERLRVTGDSALLVRLALRGPFVTVQRRTALPQRTVGSLSDRGRRAGLHLEAATVRSTALLSDLEQAQLPDREDLIDQAGGAARLIDGLRALSTADESAARSAFEDACRLLPTLGGRPGLIAGRLRNHMPRWHESGSRFSILKMATATWPDRSSDVARFLRAWAFFAALRLGLLREAARLARSWPVVGTTGFCRRVRPVVRKRLRRWALERLYRGSEDARIEHTA
jgi:hypothetical protein